MGTEEGGNQTEASEDVAGRQEAAVKLEEAGGWAEAADLEGWEEEAAVGGGSEG